MCIKQYSKTFHQKAERLPVSKEALMFNPHVGIGIPLLAALWLLAFSMARYSHRRGWLRAAYHRDIAAIGAIALGTVGFFWRLILSEDVWMPTGGGDLVSFLFPTYHFAARSLKEGTIPLWNPYLYGGAPFAADPQSGLFYPVNLLVFLLTSQLTYRTTELMAVFHFFLAGACMYTYLRGLSASQRYGAKTPRRLAALSGAFAFMFSDLFVTHFGNLNMIAVASWLPLIFLCFHRALSEGRRGLVALAGLFLGLATLAGHIQITLFIVLTLALYAAYWVWERGKRVKEERGNEVSLLRPFVYLLTCLLIAFGVAALTIIPSYEMASFTIRARIGYEEASQYSLPPTALIGLLIPGFFGRGPANYWGLWPRVEVGYIGILPLVLAFLAILLRRDRLVAFLLGLALTSLMLAMGGYTILHGWFYRSVPGFGSLRAPARFIYLFDFALAILAALGLDALLQPLSRAQRATLRRALRSSIWAFILAVIFILPLSYLNILRSQGWEREALGRMVAANNGLVFFLIMLAGSLALIYARCHRWASPQAIGLLAVALIALDLFSMGAYVEIECRDPTANYHHPTAIAFLKADDTYYRIDTRTEVWDVWQPDLSLIQGIFDVWGVYNPSVLADYHRYWEGLGSRSTPLYDFLNAKYIVGHKDVPLDWEKYVLAFDGDPQVNIYRNTEVLPRAFIVHRAQVVPDHEAAFAAIHQLGFDPAEAIVVEGGRELAGLPQAEDAVEIVRYSPNEIELEAITPTEGYLVLSEVYYPGWNAFVDGKEEGMLRADFAFRALYLQPGSHRVRLVFDPLSWRVGLGISLATWLGLAAWGALWLRGRFLMGG